MTVKQINNFRIKLDKKTKTYQIWKPVPPEHDWLEETFVPIKDKIPSLTEAIQFCQNNFDYLTPEYRAKRLTSPKE